MKKKLLCILHRSPPAHGAAKVGDFIANSKRLQKDYDCRFITIKSSDTIGDIGKVNIKKLYLVIELYVKVLWILLIFRPQKLYFTASVKGVAFYRDILISTAWKLYSFFTSLDVFYHYHTKGINTFVSISSKNLKLTNFFVNDVNLILLSPLLENDFKMITSFKSILFLPNGVEDNMNTENYDEYLKTKYTSSKVIQILYLAHMIKDKGYLEVLELAKQYKNRDIHFHFAGSWKDEKSEKDFFTYIQEYHLTDNITYHGFVSGKEKNKLFKNTSILLYPSKNDAFPLTLLESFSYGVPVLATDEGSIPFIVDNKSGIVINNMSKLGDALDSMIEKFINFDTAKYCRQRYLDNFSLYQFEDNLVKIFK